MIKLVVTDVDGTLLDENSQLPDLNKEAVYECLSRGIRVILATGKSIFAIKYLIETLQLKLPQITLNGAVVVDSSYNILKAVRIGSKYFYDIIKTIKDKNYKPLAALANGLIYYDEYDPNFRVFEEVHEPLYKVEKLEKNEYANECVSVSVAIKETDPLDSFLRKKYEQKLQVVRSGEYFFDILRKEANKGDALSYICNKLDISKKEVAVIGDSPNDLSMFKFAGLRIAVKNSFPEVLKTADYITDENYKCGFAKAVYQYILKT